MDRDASRPREVSCQDQLVDSVQTRNIDCRCERLTLIQAGSPIVFQRNWNRVYLLS